MSIKEGLKRKEKGLQSVQSHCINFVVLMRLQAQKISKRYGSVTSDDLRDYAFAIGIRPKHQNAWGAIFRGKDWKMLGWKASRVSSNHSRQNRVWKWVG